MDGRMVGRQDEIKKKKREKIRNHMFIYPIFYLFSHFLSIFSSFISLCNYMLFGYTGISISINRSSRVHEHTGKKSMGFCHHISVTSLLLRTPNPLHTHPSTHPHTYTSTAHKHNSNFIIHCKLHIHQKKHKKIYITFTRLCTLTPRRS